MSLPGPFTPINVLGEQQYDHWVFLGLEKRQPQVFGHIGKGATAIANVSYEDESGELSDQIRALVLEARAILLFASEITYRDIFGNSHRTRACFAFPSDGSSAYKGPIDQPLAMASCQLRNDIN